MSNECEPLTPGQELLAKVLAGIITVGIVTGGIWLVYIHIDALNFYM